MYGCQSEQCAIACRILAPDYDVDPFEAFLSGLAQNIGLMASLSVTDRIAAGDATLGTATFSASLLRHARALTCNIGREWDFTEAVIRAIEEQGEALETRCLSPPGKVLSVGDYLGKARILANNNCLAEGDPWLWQGFSGNAMSCYQELKNFKEQEFSAE